MPAMNEARSEASHTPASADGAKRGDAREIDREICGTFVIAEIGKRRAFGHDASIVERAVETAELGNHLADHRLDLGLVADVDRDCEGFAAALADLLDGGLTTLAIAIGDGHAGPFAGEG